VRPPYNPLNWYWIVPGQTGVWSSARLTYVAVTDATYLAWCAAGNTATTIPSAADLASVMLTQWLNPTLAAGVAVQSTATPALNATYTLDPNAPSSLPGLNAITSISTGIAAGKPLPGGGATFNYADVTGAMHAFTAANFLNFAAALESYLYLLTQAVGVLVTGGTATLPTPPVVIA
jgi:hypothetical protein